MNRRDRGLHDDPLCAASTGLLALGIDRDRRLDALEVLGQLLDHADSDGVVVLDRGLYTLEETMGVDKCLDAYTLLEHIDVVQRTDRGWVIPNYDLHHGPVGETLASLAVLRKHMASIGAESADNVVPLQPAAAVTPIKKWRRAVPLAAAGLAASAAALTGVAQFAPQAAVSGRDVAAGASAPTSVVKRLTSEVPGATVTSDGSAPNTTGAALPTTIAGATQTTAGGVACLAPKVLATVTAVDLVRIPFGGDKGETIWAAVVSGTATLTDGTDPLLLPGLSVVAHVVGGDTDPVQATLAVPLLTPAVPSPFTAVVALGTSKPVDAVTATAKAEGVAGC